MKPQASEAQIQEIGSVTERPKKTAGFIASTPSRTFVKTAIKSSEPSTANPIQVIYKKAQNW